MTFEQVVIDALAELAPVLKAAEKGKTSASALYRMLDSGNIRNIEKKLTEAEEELSKALEGIRTFKEWWQKNGLDGYFGSPEYTTELTECLDESGVDYHQVGNAFYVYPALVRLEQDSKVVRIDKKTELRLRPKTLAKILYDIQNRPSKFPAGRFLRTLFKVYKALASANLKKSETWVGKSLFLRDIYEVLSAAPGSNYSEEEFVRDIYLLDASGETLEVGGYVASLEASSTTRNVRKVLEIITRDGQRRLYCTIRFDPLTR